MIKERHRVIICMASDHAAWSLKTALKSRIAEAGHDCRDLGTESEQTSVDYPDYAAELASVMETLSATEAGAGVRIVGILLCGSGIGMSVAANRYPHLRAALCRTAEDAYWARRHNDANVLVLGGRVTSKKEAGAILDVFLKETFDGGRHQRRVEKMNRRPDRERREQHSVSPA